MSSIARIRMRPLLVVALAVAGCAVGGENGPDRESPAAGTEPVRDVPEAPEAAHPEELPDAGAAVTTAVPCEPRPAGTLEDVDPAALAGHYRLVVVARSGPASGARVEASLRLRRQASGLRELVGPDGRVMAPNTRQELIGTVSGDLAAVGAQIPGDPRSDDPEAPGVSGLVMYAPESQLHRPDRILFRLGAEVNVRGRLTFDDAFTLLRVERVEADAVFGSWQSDGPAGGAGGYFCAMR